MAPLPDPQELRAIAARIGAAATAARAQAAHLQARVAAVAWQGAAATVFDLLAGDVITGLRRSADRLDDAADALRRHAANVEHALAVILRAGSGGVAVGTDLVHGVADEVLHPNRLLGDTAALISDGVSLARDVGGLFGIG
jgi:uncharacterized protein YukE